MQTLINILLTTVLSSAIVIFSAAVQTVLDYLEERADYKSQIRELQELLEQQNTQMNARFYLEVAKSESDPIERAYFEAKAINEIKK